MDSHFRNETRLELFLSNYKNCDIFITNNSEDHINFVRTGKMALISAHSQYIKHMDQANEDNIYEYLIKASGLILLTYVT